MIPVKKVNLVDISMDREIHNQNLFQETNPLRTGERMAISGLVKCNWG